MSAIQQLITEHMDIWTAADTGKRSGRGRASSNAGSVYGVKKLRELILELAVRGKLVPQNANDEPASELLKHIQAEKAKLVARGKIKKDKPLAAISDEDKPFVLPTGWEWARLGDLAEIVRGVTYGKSDASDNPLPDYVPLLRGNNIDWFLNFDRPVFVPKKLLIETQFVKAGDIVIAMSSGSADLVGKAAQATEDFNGGFGAFCGVVRAISDEIFSFFGFFFQTPLYRIRAAGHGKGIGINNLQKTALQTLEVPLPPLAEQHRIVAKVDELMALCDQLEAQHSNTAEAHEKLVSHLLGTLTQSQNADVFSANWQRIAAHFDTLFTTEASIDALKQTLLQLAVMGKLVPQDANDEPASELLIRIQAEKSKLVAEGKIKKDKPLAPIADDEKPFDLPSGWECVRLNDITSIRGGSTPSMAKSEYWGGKILWVSPKDMHGGIIVDSELKITEKALKETGLELVPIGSILIVGRSGILKRKLPAQITAVHCTINQDIKAVTPIKPLSDRYMQLIFWGNEKEILVRDVKQGTTVQSLVYESLFSRPFSLPPAAEQNRIVAKVDSLMALCDQLKTRITVANQQQQKLADVLVAQAVAG